VYRNNTELKDFTQFSNAGNEVAFGTIGDASTSEGLFFEAMNAAGVLQVPLAMSVWDDGYGISVPTRYQTTKGNISKALEGFREDGEGNGMVSTIEEMKKPEVLIFKHLGMIKDGKEDLESEEVKGWSGSLEKYFLSQNGDTTTVKVELATLPEYIGMLKSGFIQGFEAVKQMAEK
jgi:hypothetical protein